MKHTRHDRIVKLTRGRADDEAADDAWFLGHERKVVDHLIQIIRHLHATNVALKAAIREGARRADAPGR